MHVEPELHRSLDRAIDDLLAQGSWTVEGPAGQGAEIGPLMDVAIQVLELARRTPAISATKKQRIWRRVERALRHWGEADLQLRCRIRACARLPARHAGAATAAMAAGLGPRPLEGVRR